jgi:EAL domain-containing protein (putative c-di-GMP-specific phosphodiesterase class I)
MEQEYTDHDRFTFSNCADKRSINFDFTFDFDFTIAFQPIINCKTKQVYGYEALVRGLNNEPACSIISRVNDDDRYLFDQLCRVKAIALASKLNLVSMLSLNFFPNAIYKSERSIQNTLDAAKQYNFPIEKIIFEFTEVDIMKDPTAIKAIVDSYGKMGFLTAIDDFGSGYSGLGLLADFQTNLVKLDMELIRNINEDSVRQSIVKNCLNMFRDLKITPIAEGVETKEEFICLRDFGIELMQGYLFAKAGFELLPPVEFNALGNPPDK